MSFLKQFNRAILTFVVGLVVMVFSVGFGATSASANVNPEPAGSVTSVVQPSCAVDHAVINITDATPPGVGPGYGGIWYYLVSSRGAESQTPDSVDRLSSFALNSLPMSLGETVTFTVKAQLDTPEGSPPLVVIDSFTATRPNACGEPIVVTAVVPVATDQVITCTKDFTLKTVGASITIPVIQGVEYLLDGKVVTGTLSVVPGTYSFTARAKDGFVLSAPLNVFLGVNAGVAPVCKKPVVVVVTPPTTPKVTPPKATPVALPRVSTPVKTTAPVTNPKIVTDYVSDSPPKVVTAQVGSTGFGWSLLVVGFGAMLLIGSVLPRRKVQENKH